jgi:cardiolipin synthase (CMP-forming)
VGSPARVDGDAGPSDRVLTVPNLLSMLRLVGVPVFLWLVLGPQADGWALVVLLVAGATDFLDGYLARRFGQVSRLGQLLDPIADRLYILAALVGLVLRDIVPWWLAATVVARDVLIALALPWLRHYGHLGLPVHFLGKAATFNLLYAFPLLLLGDGSGALAALARVFGWAFALWGVGLYWWAGVLYAEQARRLVGLSRSEGALGAHRTEPARREPGADSS